MMLITVYAIMTSGETPGKASSNEKKQEQLGTMINRHKKKELIIMIGDTSVHTGVLGGKE